MDNHIHNQKSKHERERDSMTAYMQGLLISKPLLSHQISWAIDASACDDRRKMGEAISRDWMKVCGLCINHAKLNGGLTND